MRRNLKRIAAAFVGALFALLPIAALAHPLGNFTINRYAGLLVRADSIVVDYVIDMAEIPAYQEMSQIDPNARTSLDNTEAADYSARRCGEFPQKMDLTLNHRALSFTLTDSALEFPPGAGGLATLRLTCTYRAALGNLAAPNTVNFHDANYSDRIGWREIVVRGDGVTLLDSRAPTSSLSNRLRNYPTDFLSNPPKQNETHFGFTPTAVRSDSFALAENSGVTIRPQDAFAALIATDNVSIPVVLLSLAIAVVLGALHAVSPGHGKTIMAAYLVGTRGTVGQALLLGFTVTLTHTLGVLALGLITLFASRYILPESLYPLLSLASGVLVVVMGMTLVYNRRRGREEEHHHDHIHLHAHSQGDEAHPHSHSHLPPEVLRGGLTLPSLIGLGLVGGLVPSTSALILLLAAISLQRIAFGIVLIVAFGLGMALVLVGVGVLLVRASHWLERWSTPARLLPAMPLISAVVVIGAGLIVTLQALFQLGIRI